MDVDQATFDARLDEYQATLAEEAWEAEKRSHIVAARPDAEPAATTVAELRPGDYMTNEGPGGRWVKIAELRGPSCSVKRRERNRTPADSEVSILFEIPEAVTVSGERRFWIERPLDEAVTIDEKPRREGGGD